MRLARLDTQFTIHRLPPGAEIPSALLGRKFVWIGRTADELSLICESSLAIDSERQEAGWSCFRVPGTIDFGETGILAGLTAVLAVADVSVVALSTFDTDYFLVKTERLEDAVNSLESAGYSIDPQR